MMRRSTRASRAGNGVAPSVVPLPPSRSISRRISRLHVRCLMHGGRLPFRQYQPPLPDGGDDQHRDDHHEQQRDERVQVVVENQAGRAPARGAPAGRGGGPGTPTPARPGNPPPPRPPPRPPPPT